MIKADYKDRELIVNILTSSFDDNKSVNYIIKQDSKRAKRLRSLMEYSFDVCYLFGEVFLTDDKKACALIVLPDKKKTTLKSIMLDLKLIVSCVGLLNIKKALNRESVIKKNHPKGLMHYLWFIGVAPGDQNNGIGSGLLGELIQESAVKERPIYLETSTLKNIPWYEKFGFTVYNKLDFGYKLFCLKRD
ncbi:GNAT family N-acetyltransferase [Terrimonas pollutisoli]|uniref:GNAT family N-acetyltransferase n=1 Tax=Terrimonas pollutisoli TaxID=3034147 RepID=UPI0023EDE614|nr:GNAT family N-acetyltransferase [Terrimonas sp. H1YJ31]